MANLTILISTMKTAQQGEDVRDAIADTLEAVNVDNIKISGDYAQIITAAGQVGSAVTTATASAATATDKATEASNSAATAASAADTATTKASQATGSATVAAGSETSAANAATTATTKAGQAAASASAASGSELGAATSATTATEKAAQASDHAISASASATAAGTKATEAAGSATTAQAAATTSTTKAGEAADSAATAEASASAAELVTGVTAEKIAIWDAKEDTANKGVAGGYADLDETGKVPAAQLPVMDGHAHTNKAILDKITAGTKVSYDLDDFGDMKKTTYDVNGNGIVDNTEKVNGHTVESDVPAGAKFTDTTYAVATQTTDGLLGATDKTKLDGIVGTRVMTAAEILTEIKTVDGPGSGLNADLLDGKDATEFALSSHGTHVTYGAATTALASGGTGSIGSAATLARSDHTHTLSAYPDLVTHAGDINIHVTAAKQTEWNGNATSLNTHANALISAAALHGLRVDATTKALEFFNGVEWKRVSKGYPVGNVTGFTASTGDGKITLNWNDPTDVTVTDSNGTVITIAKWAGTRILRKTGSYPANENDGTLVINNGVQDQYVSTGYQDTGLTNDTTYYYAAFPYTEDNVFTVSTANRISGVPQAFAVYGVSIDLTNSNPLTSVTYTDNAIGVTKGSAAWDTMAIFKDIKPCVLLNGVVQYYLNPANFAQKADGSAADITSGSAGDVMIEIPKIGFKITSVGNVVTVKITENPADSNYKYYAHTRTTEGDKNKLYVGAFLGYALSSKLRSLLGKAPTATQTIGTFRTQAQANGTGYDMLSFYPYLLLQCLYLIRYGSLDSQTALGRGFVDANSAAINTGGTVAKGMNFGETTGKLQMKFLGIEDFWGNLYQFLDGLFSDASRNILTAFKAFNDTGSGYTNRGQGAATDIGGYLSSPQGTSESGFIVKTCSGSETTYFSDSAGLYVGCLACFGGGWDGASYAGTFQLIVSIGASNSYATYGARLMYL